MRKGRMSKERKSVRGGRADDGGDGEYPTRRVRLGRELRGRRSPRY